MNSDIKDFRRVPAVADRVSHLKMTFKIRHWHLGFREVRYKINIKTYKKKN